MFNRCQTLVFGNIFKHVKRSFLSDAYKCTDSWNSRLKTPILQKVNLESLYQELEQQFQQKGRISAIDVDVLANKITNENFTEELADLVHKLRMTKETTNSSDSMSHALIRYYLDCNHINELLDILNNRIGYGIFLDYFTANLVLDKLIKAKDYLSAARIATQLMLQEEFDNSISIYLSLYACWKYLENPQPFVEPEIIKTDQPAVGQVKKKKPEEIKIRVNFLRNEYFDHHFDLIDSQLLVGKTLIMIGKCLDDTALGNSVQLLGYTLYQKYTEGMEFLKNINGSFYKEAVKMCINILSEIKVSENVEGFQPFSDLLKHLETSQTALIDIDMEKDICKLTNETVEEFTAIDITAQVKKYDKWLTVREMKLNTELNRLDRAKRLADIEKINTEMETEEQKLWFFENEDKIDLQIDSKIPRYRKRWFGKKKKPRTIDAEYVPPEV